MKVGDTVYYASYPTQIVEVQGNEAKLDTGSILDIEKQKVTIIRSDGKHLIFPVITKTEAEIIDFQQRSTIAVDNMKKEIQNRKYSLAQMKKIVDFYNNL